jgi:hypothetical protein
MELLGRELWLVLGELGKAGRNPKRTDGLVSGICYPLEC